jgi:hypothetical protein
VDWAEPVSSRTKTRRRLADLDFNVIKGTAKDTQSYIYNKSD